MYILFLILLVSLFCQFCWNENTKYIRSFLLTDDTTTGDEGKQQHAASSTITMTGSAKKKKEKKLTVAKLRAEEQTQAQIAATGYR